MKKIYGRWLKQFGWNPQITLSALKAMPQFLVDRRSYRQAVGRDKTFSFSTCNPCLHDAREESGSTRSHYFLQDLLMAQEIFRASPHRHVDVASKMNGFVAHVASFREIEVFDIRPSRANLPNILFKQVNFTHLEAVPEEYCDSISCLHALEHFGLGRYGDPIAPDGWRQGLACLAQMVADNGKLYLSVPISLNQRVEFNGQRVFHPQTVPLEASKLGLKLIRFRWLDDQLTVNETSSICLEDAGFGTLRYGCGLYEFKRESRSSSRP